jgi:hypothetical protein
MPRVFFFIFWHLKGEADMRHFEFISSIETAPEDDLSIKRDSDFSASADVFVVVSCLWEVPAKRRSKWVKLQI